jgi:probable addiction module antidote protein
MTTAKTRPFDPAEYLDSDTAIAAYMIEALETDDPSFVVDALGVVARARGMTEVARGAGVSRESLYRALSMEGNPEFATVMRVVKVLGLHSPYPRCAATTRPDSQQSPCSVMTISNATGSVVTQYAYLPYGDSAPPNLAACLGAGGSSSTCGSPSGTGFGYDGYRYNPEAGLYHTGARYYDPRLGRFIQPDPIGQAGGLNLYAYVNNDPLNLSDPSGLLAGEVGSAVWGLTTPAATGIQLAAYQPPPTNADGSPAPPPTQLPPGRNGEPNSWVASPGSGTGDRDTSWNPQYPVPSQSGGQPRASWDAQNGHWDVNNGRGGPRERYLPDGTPVDHYNNPIPFIVPTPLSPITPIPGFQLPALPGLRIPVPIF